MELLNWLHNQVVSFQNLAALFPLVIVGWFIKLVWEEARSQRPTPRASTDEPEIRERRNQSQTQHREQSLEPQAIAHQGRRYAVLGEALNMRAAAKRQLRTLEELESLAPKPSFVDWEGRPAVILGSSAWFVPFGSDAWLPTRVEEVVESGVLISAERFARMFPRLPKTLPEIKLDCGR